MLSLLYEFAVCYVMRFKCKTFILGQEKKESKMIIGEKIRILSIKEAKELYKQYLDFQSKKVEIVFRTSINAESLYLFRPKARYEA